MEIWNYHPTTGLLLGAGIADPSPVEAGVWLIPAFAVTVAPPAPEDGQEVAWDGEAWVQRPVPPPPAAAPAVPAFVALWQFRRELKARGWWNEVLGVIATLPASARDDAMEWLEYGERAERASPMLIALATAIGVADEIDEAFIAASARVL